MTGAVRDALNDLVGAVAAEANIARDRIMDITLVGNPVMHHLLLGIDPIELGGAPFALASDEAVTLLASELDIHAHPGARSLRTTVYRWPLGADTAGVILSEQPHLGDAITLLVDVGTNAEIVLGNSERLLPVQAPPGLPSKVPRSARGSARRRSHREGENR